MTHAIDIGRRRFLLGALGCGALARSSWASAAPFAARPWRARDSGAERTLVLIQLTGGNDGLSTLVPYGDDGYGRARSTTRWPAKDVLRIDGRVGLHSELATLHAQYQEGRLALLEGVGYPQPNRSHGHSLDIWHAADPRGRAVGEGWVGRLVAWLEEPAVTALVHIGARPPFALQSRGRPPILVTSASRLARAEDDDPARELANGSAPAPPESPANGPTSLDFLRRAAEDSRAASSAVQAALDAHAPRVRYPSSAFARDLSSAAALIHAGIGLRVCSLELEGFDTHRDQRGRHDSRMAELDSGLAAFVADLASSERGRGTLVLVFSEFGRRLEENASRGTDHGAAGLMLALGASVRGGLHGAPPSLTELEDGDPAFTTDFRSVYARAIEHVFGLAHEKVLGARFPMQEWV